MFGIIVDDITENCQGIVMPPRKCKDELGTRWWEVDAFGCHCDNMTSIVVLS
jgi:hypothetical protein